MSSLGLFRLSPRFAMAAVRFLLLSISVVLFVSLTVVTEASYSMSRSGRSRNVDWSNTDSLARTLDMTNSGKFLALRGKKSVDHLLRGRRGENNGFNHLLRGRRADDFYRILRAGNFNHLLRGKRGGEQVYGGEMAEEVQDMEQAYGEDDEY